MKNAQRFILNQDYKAEQFDDEMLLYAVSTGRGVHLNQTAFLVWEMCGKGLSVGEMTAQLEEAFPEQQAVIRADLAAALQALLENSILLPADEQGG